TCDLTGELTSFPPGRRLYFATVLRQSPRCCRNPRVVNCATGLYETAHAFLGTTRRLHAMTIARIAHWTALAVLSLAFSAPAHAQSPWPAPAAGPGQFPAANPPPPAAGPGQFPPANAPAPAAAQGQFPAANSPQML